METYLKLITIAFIVFACSTSTDDISDENDYPNSDLNEFTDGRDGKTYKIVKIGNQTWMAENLAFLPKVTSPANGPRFDNFEQFENEVFYYVYGYDGDIISAAKATDNFKKCGVLYDWNSAQTACPAGWHLPSKLEWETLANYISNKHSGYTKEVKDRGQISWKEVAAHIKSSSNWNNNGNGTDDYDLRCIAAGFRNNDGNFYGRGNECRFWTNTEESIQTKEAYCIAMRDFNQTFDLLLGREIDGFSIRCIKD